MLGPREDEGGEDDVREDDVREDGEVARPDDSSPGPLVLALAWQKEEAGTADPDTDTALSPPPPASTRRRLWSLSSPGDDAGDDDDDDDGRRRFDPGFADSEVLIPPPPPQPPLPPPLPPPPLPLLPPLPPARAAHWSARMAWASAAVMGASWEPTAVETLTAEEWSDARKRHARRPTRECARLHVDKEEEEEDDDDDDDDDDADVEAGAEEEAGAEVGVAWGRAHGEPAPTANPAANPAGADGALLAPTSAATFRVSK